MHKSSAAIVLGAEVLLSVLTVTRNVHLQYALNVNAQFINPSIYSNSDIIMIGP